MGQHYVPHVYGLPRAERGSGRGEKVDGVSDLAVVRVQGTLNERQGSVPNDSLRVID